VQQAGFGPTAVRVSATVWPSHAHVALAQGDVVTLEGSYTQNKSTNEETGETRTYHNISVLRLKNHGPLDAGTKTETVNTPDAADEDIPF
jgi:hypothetical protein